MSASVKRHQRHSLLPLYIPEEPYQIVGTALLFVRRHNAFRRV